jgi:hypothetical protein
MYTTTTINVQGGPQDAFEVYADDTREQTIAFVFDEAKANLIAAAPDLLEACKNVFSWHANHFEDFDKQTNSELLELANEIEAAIAKAEVAGSSPASVS